MRAVLIRFFVFYSAIFYAQKLKQFDVELIRIKEPVLNSDVFSGEYIHLNSELIPVFNYQEKIESQIVPSSYQLKIMDSEYIDSSICEEIQINSLPKDVELQLNVSSNKGQPYLNYQFYPLLQKNGKILKINKVEISHNAQVFSFKTQQVSKINAVQNSVLSSGRWYKIAVDQSGIYKIDASFLNSIGIDVNGLNPNHIKIYGSGGAVLSEELNEGDKNGLVENAIEVIGGEDGVFDPEDMIVFYAQGPLSWELNSREDIKHKTNYYSNYGYYFINVDSGAFGKRITNRLEVNNPTTQEINTFTDFKLHEQELFNYLGTGKKWFGEDFSIDSNQTFRFDFPNISSDRDVIIETSYSTNSPISTFYTLNYGLGSSVTTMSSNIFFNEFQIRNSSVSFTPNQSNLELNISYSNNGAIAAQAYLDYIKVIADRNLVATGEQFGFQSFNSLSQGDILEYSVSNSQNIDAIWDVSDLNNPQKINNTSNNTDFRFKELTNGVLNKYHLVNLQDLYTPIHLGEEALVSNQNLQALTDVHYVIITHSTLMSQAERLAAYHRTHTAISDSNSNFVNVQVVDIEQIYNEFGSGAPDISAVRNFVKYLYDNASSEENKVKYLCLFGDASYDYKNITHDNEVNIFCYNNEFSQSLRDSYNSDDFYAYMDDLDIVSDTNNGLNTAPDVDIATGRIPVGNASEASIVVDKILRYYSASSFGNWKNIVALLGDDGQENDSQDLIAAIEAERNADGDVLTEGFASYLEAENQDFNVSKLYSDAFEETFTAGGASYPEVKTRFLNAFDQGALVINYFGHGNSFALAEENFLDISDIRAIRNLDNLPLFITVTCDFSRFDDHTIVSGGEELVLGEFGGVSSLLTTTRQILISAGRELSDGLAQELFVKEDQRTIAEILKDVKNDSFSQDKFFVYFIGDPAMELSIPDGNIRIDRVQKVTLEEGSEVLTNTTDLQGLSRLRVTGSVLSDEEVLQDFNGELSVTLFGAEIQRSTLLNEEGGVSAANQNSVVHYGSLENKLFVGSASVSSGTFSFDFVLPKDVNPNSESSKFSFYAFSNNQEKTGSDFSFRVGGVDPDVEEDQTPPEISLFMDSVAFLEGGNTSSTPLLIAELSDANGINTSLGSLGHDISLVLDGDLLNPISLNEFYTTKKNNFTQGVVEFELDELELGLHTITLKAWDTHNNSATQTLSFVVVEDGDFEITNVLNYPNPFINYTEFWFQNNRVNNPLEIRIQIFTVSGKLVKTILGTDVNTNSDSTGFVRSMRWDGKDDFGNKIGKGVYVYKIKVKDIISGETDEKIEKLVLL